MVLVGHSIRDHRDMADKVVCEEAVGNNRGICSRETNIQNLHRRRADEEVQNIPKVVLPRRKTQSDR